MKNTVQIYRFLAFLPNDFHAFLLYLIFFNQKGGDVNLFFAVFDWFNFTE